MRDAGVGLGRLRGGEEREVEGICLEVPSAVAGMKRGGRGPEIEASMPRADS